MDAFFKIPNAPIQSVVAIDNYEAAISIPRRDIVLNFCNCCGFIFNSEFDTEWDYYTKGYEDQQGFSPTFVEFITRKTQRFIDQYNIKEKLVVEIGCGKGDFIRLMCDLGRNRGVGIDPAWVPGRFPEREDVRFIRDFYSLGHGDLSADCITCRHTLEHIFEVDEFMQTIRASCQGRKPTLFFEVPCMLRILQVQAFWDIFGEHCSYFSPGSLARVFRRNGFEVVDMFIAYKEQYLFIVARPVEKPSTWTHPLEESIEALRAIIQVFVRQIEAQVDAWRARLLHYKETGKKVVIYGGGSKSVAFLTQFDAIGLIEHVVDINPHIQGNYIPGIGLQYVGPDFLKIYQPDVVIMMNSIYTEEIRNSLHVRGLFPELIGL